MIENTFGIMASRWRILRKPIIAHPNTVDSIVRATIVLHNFLRVVANNDTLSLVWSIGKLNMDRYRYI